MAGIGMFRLSTAMPPIRAAEYEAGSKKSPSAIKFFVKIEAVLAGTELRFAFFAL
jgi:hypothetical protein